MTPSSEEDENFEQFLNIVSEAANQARDLYNNGVDDATDTSSVEQF